MDIQNDGPRVVRTTAFCAVASNTWPDQGSSVWHPSGAWNFQVAPRCLEFVHHRTHVPLTAPPRGAPLYTCTTHCATSWCTPVRMCHPLRHLVMHSCKLRHLVMHPCTHVPPTAPPRDAFLPSALVSVRTAYTVHLLVRRIVPVAICLLFCNW
jgi:hypothetical protein